MKLLNACFPSVQPVVPTSLKKRIDIFYTCVPSESECRAFSSVLVGLEKMLARDITIKPELWAHVIFLGSPVVSFVMDEQASGSFCPFILFPVYQWRKNGYDTLKITLAMVEEICHCFWSIRDESRVKQKDIAFMKQMGLSLSWPNQPRQ